MIFSCWKHTIIAEIEEKLFLFEAKHLSSNCRTSLLFNRRHLPSSPTTSAASDTAEVMDEGQFDLTRSGINSAFEFDSSGYKSENYLNMGRPSVSKFEHIGIRAMKPTPVHLIIYHRQESHADLPLIYHRHHELRCLCCRRQSHHAPPHPITPVKGKEFVLLLVMDFKKLMWEARCVVG